VRKLDEQLQFVVDEIIDKTSTESISEMRNHPWYEVQEHFLLWILRAARLDDTNGPFYALLNYIDSNDGAVSHDWTEQGAYTGDSGNVPVLLDTWSSATVTTNLGVVNSDLTGYWMDAYIYIQGKFDTATASLSEGKKDECMKLLQAQLMNAYLTKAKSLFSTPGSSFLTGTDTADALLIANLGTDGPLETNQDGNDVQIDLSYCPA